MKQSDEAAHLRRLIREGLRFLVIQPRANNDRIYQALVDAAQQDSSDQ